MPHPLLPQGLCTSSPSCLECSSPRHLHGSFLRPPSGLCLNVTFSNMAYPCYSNTATCFPAFAFLPFIPYPPEVLYFFPKPLSLDVIYIFIVFIMYCLFPPMRIWVPQGQRSLFCSSLYLMHLEQYPVYRESSIHIC